MCLKTSSVPGKVLTGIHVLQSRDTEGWNDRSMQPVVAGAFIWQCTTPTFQLLLGPMSILFLSIVSGQLIFICVWKSAFNKIISLLSLKEGSVSG